MDELKINTPLTKTNIHKWAKEEAKKRKAAAPLSHRPKASAKSILIEVLLAHNASNYLGVVLSVDEHEGNFDFPPDKLRSAIFNG